MIILAPFGIASGYVSVTLGFLLAHAGMPTAAVAVIVAFSLWPLTLQMFWSPLIDTTLTTKRWHIIGSVLTALAILALSLSPATVANAAPLTLLVIVLTLASTLVSLTSGRLKAYGVEEARKGKAAGWAEAGSLGSSAIGGGIGLWVAHHAPAPWFSGLILAALCLACPIALLFVADAEPEARPERYLDRLTDIAKDIWRTARTRIGFLGLLLMLLPLGTGAASNLFSAVASEWRVGEDAVALVNGVLAGVAQIFGAIVGGVICDLIDRRRAFCLFGLAPAVVTIAMALLPRTPQVFIGLTLAYYLVNGFCYAGFAAVVLEAVGRGAAGTKSSLLVAASNVPVALMTTLDGRWHDQFGVNGMLYGEAGVAIIAVIAMAVFVRATRDWRLGLGARIPSAAE